MQHRLLDTLGSVFSLSATVLFVRINVWAWPVSLTAMVINIILYAHTGLYADMSKDMLYGFLIAYGWHQWLRGGPHKSKRAISHLSKMQYFCLATINLVSILLLAKTLQYFTNSTVPYWDATTTVLSLNAQWLTCRKHIECWLLWLLVDGLYAGLYFYKALPVHASLMLLYVALAIVGFWNWYRQMSNHAVADTTHTTQPHVNPV